MKHLRISDKCTDVLHVFQVFLSLSIYSFVFYTVSIVCICVLFNVSCECPNEPCLPARCHMSFEQTAVSESGFVNPAGVGFGRI